MLTNPGGYVAAPNADRRPTESVSEGRKANKTRGRAAINPYKVLHYGGSFWAQRDRAAFCSTSCRTLYHRALKGAIPQAIMALYGLPGEKAMDIVETQPMGKVRELLEAARYIYQHQERRWQVGLMFSD